MTRLSSYFIIVALASVCHGLITPKTLIYDVRSGNVIRYNGPRAQKNEENGFEQIKKVHALQKLYSGASSFVVHGADTKDQLMARAPFDLFHRFSPDELIVVGNVPETVFSSLENIRDNVKYLTLYRYSGFTLQNPCEVFPELEELIIERTDLLIMDLKACKTIGLKKLWVRNYALKTTSQTKNKKNNKKDRNVQLMLEVSQVRHSIMHKPMQVARWNQTDRSYFYNDQQRLAYVDQLIELDEEVIAEALHSKMEYLQVAPCSNKFLESLTTGKKQIDRTNTILQLVFSPARSFVGTLQSFFIEIYDMQQPPSAELLQALPQRNLRLGIRCDADILSPPWRDSLVRFSELVHLRLDARPGIIDALTGAKKLFTAYLKNVNEITLAFTERDVLSEKSKEFAEKQATVQKDVAAFLSTLELKLNIIFSGRNQYDLSGLCTSGDAQVIDGVQEKEYVCMPPKKQQTA